MEGTPVLAVGQGAHALQVVAARRVDAAFLELHAAPNLKGRRMIRYVVEDEAR